MRVSIKRTDLEPECDRSRRGSGPISSRNATDLGAEADRSRRRGVPGGSPGWEVSAQPSLRGDEDQRPQQHEQTQGERRGLLENLRVLPRRLDRRGDDGEVLRRDDLAQAAADRVGRQEDARVEVRGLRGGRLQVGEQGAGARRRARHGRAEPAQGRGQEGEDHPRRRQRGSHGAGLPREVHDIRQSHHGGDRDDRHAQRVDRLRQRPQHAPGAHLEPAARGAPGVDDRHNHGRDEDPCARVGHGLQGVHGAVGGLAAAGEQLAVDAGPGDLDIGAGQYLGQIDPDLPQLGDADHDNDQDVGQQGQDDALGAGLVVVAGLRVELLGSGRRRPHQQEEVGGGEAHEGRHDTGQLVGHVRRDEVAASGGQPGDQRQGPQLAHRTHAVEDPQQEEGHEHADDPGEVGHEDPDDRRVLPAAEVPGGGHGDGHGAEAHVDGVADDRHERGLDLLHAEGHEHGGGDRHRRPEARQALQQTAEAEGDDQRLGAHVPLADRIEHGPQIRRAPGDLGEVVEPHGGDDDVDDRDESHGQALRPGQECHAHRHVEAHDRQHHGQSERDDRAPVRGDLEGTHEDEEGDQGRDAHDRREEHISAHRRC